MIGISYPFLNVLTLTVDKFLEVKAISKCNPWIFIDHLIITDIVCDILRKAFNTQAPLDTFLFIESLMIYLIFLLKLKYM
jgi:hypothetical protein